MGLIRDLLGGATHAECEAYMEALTRPFDTEEELLGAEQDAATLRAGLPEGVARMIEDGRYR